MALNNEEFDLVTDCVSFLENYNDKLNDFEKEFLTGKGPQDQYDSLVEKFEKYGRDIKLSEKQINVLRKLRDKIEKI